MKASLPQITLVLVISFFVLACQSVSNKGLNTLSEPTDLARDPAAQDDDRIVKRADRLLRNLYLAEFHATQFERELDLILAQKEKKPEILPRPMAGAHYQQLNRLWEEVFTEKATLISSYTQELQQTVSLQHSDSDLVHSQTALEQFHRWLGGLSEADQLQLLPLLRELSRARQSFEAVSSNEVSKPNARNIASSLELPTWVNETDLSERFTRHQDEIQKKAKEAFRDESARDDAIENFFSELVAAAPKADPASAPDRRAAQGEISEQNKRKLKVFPSTGREGNFIGTELSMGQVVLTYDDGPSSSITPRLLKILKSYRDPLHSRGAPASFFVLGQRVVAERSVFDQQKALGFPLNNHSYSHINFAKATEAQLDREIIENHKLLLKALNGKKYQFFRCPYGACIAPKVAAARERIARIGLIHAYWSVDSLDWKHVGQPRRIADLVIKQLKLDGKGLVLMHDIHESTLQATEMVLAWIKEQNQSGSRLKLMTLEDAVGDYNHH